MIFAYRPIANPKITHNMHADNPKLDKMAAVEIGKTAKPIKITYNWSAVNHPFRAPLHTSYVCLMRICFLLA